jgi:hypothetical protein
MKRIGFSALLGALLALAVTIACGGGSVGSGGGGGSNPVTVSVSPTTASVPTGGKQSFTAIVSGTSNTAVTWSVSGVNGGNSTVGTIDQSGNYTAPLSVPNGGQVTVTATSQENPDAKGNATVTITVIAVTISPTKATMPGGGTPIQFTATVTGTQNTAVTWSSTGTGSVSQTGLFSAPPVGSPSSAMVKATSQADPTKFATATITITVGPIVINSITPPAFSLDHYKLGFCCVDITGSGFATGDTYTLTPNINNSGEGSGCSINSPTDISCSIFVDAMQFDPGPVVFQLSSADGTVQSNPATFLFFGSQNWLVASETDAIVNDNDPSFPWPQVNKFKLTDGSSDGSFETKGSTETGFAYDNGTGDLYEVIWAGPNIGQYVIGTGQEGQGGAYTPGRFNMGLDAKDSMACTSELNFGGGNNGDLVCAPVSNAGATQSASVPAGTEPWPVAIGRGCGGDSAFTYDREDTQIFQFPISVDGGGNIQINQSVSPLTITNLIPASKFRSAFPLNGNWYLAAFDGSCTAAVFAPGLDGEGNMITQLVIIAGSQNGGSMTQLGSAIDLPTLAFRIGTDNTHNAVIVAYDDPAGTGLTRFKSIDMASGTVTGLTTTSTLRAGGFAVSPDGQSLYYGVRDQFIPPSQMPNQ